MKRRVLFLETTLLVGGAERVMSDVIRQLDRDRFEPVLCTLKEPGVLAQPLIRDGLRCYGSLYRHRYDARAGYRVHSIIKQERPDVVFFNFGSMNALLGGWPAVLAGVPRVVAAFHTTHRWNRPVVTWYDRLFLKHLDSIVAVGEAQARYLVEEEGIEPERLRVIHNGIDTRRFHGAITPARDLAARKAEGRRLVGLVAALRPEKAHGVFLEAAARIAKQMPEVDFVLVGDGPERSSIEATIERLGLQGRVLMLGTRSDLPAIHAALDVVALSSYPVVETFSIAILEAMACEKPIVTTDVGSLREMVVDGHTGSLVPHSDPERLAASLSDMLRDPARAREMGRAGRRRVVEHFSIERMVKSYEELLSEEATADLAAV
ncbi:MAG: glycosyltransferase [Planctomycetota bacterium]